MPKAKQKKNLTWKGHKEKWSDCTLCDLCEQRKKVVLLKGKIPCDILFVGEAPGQSEDVLGKPFVGPGGHLLDKMIAQTLGDDFRLAFTNLVGCIPKDDDGNKMKEPSNKSIKACGERIREIVNLTKPEVIVSVGKLPKKWLDKVIPHREIPSVQIIHPAAIVRADVSQQGLAIQRTEIALRDVAEKIVPF